MDKANRHYLKKKQKNLIKTVLRGYLLLSVFLGLLGITSTTIVGAESYPSKTIKLIVPSNPGGGYDTYARKVSMYLPKYLPNKVNVVVKNIPGSGGLNGATTLFNSKPDGYTIGYIYFPSISLVARTTNIGFDPEKAVFLGRIAFDIQVLLVSPKSGLKTVEDLQKKDPIRLCSSPKGTTANLQTVMAGEILKLTYKIVTGYRGTSEMILGVMRGDGDAGIFNLGNYIDFIRSGKLRAIATCSIKRSPLTPDVPSFAELGYPEAATIRDRKLLFAPPGLPPDKLKILKTALQKALDDPELKAWSNKAGMGLGYMESKAAWEELQQFASIYKRYY
ncbi:Bug family tripartite tricarboxylate transporter substrate binding protein [Thermodesulfobacteriota bacterium]